MRNLDSFVQHSRPQPGAPLATSQEIRDRGSLFVAAIYRATTPSGAQEVVQHVKHVLHHAKPASHEISAWRCMVPKHGRTGLGGPEDFEVKEGSNDDGEQWGGGKALKVMRTLGVIDAVVIVSRWYGGTLLGPARFSHIETCALEVCRTFKRVEEIEECVSTLTTLDDILADLRGELNALSAISSESDGGPSSTATQSNPAPTPSKRPNYESILHSADLPTAKRLVNARENAIKSVKSTLARRKLEMKQKT